MVPGVRRLGITGVPYFIISAGGKQYALSGAQPASAFVQTVNKALAEQQQGE